MKNYIFDFDGTLMDIGLRLQEIPAVLYPGHEQLGKPMPDQVLTIPRKLNWNTDYPTAIFIIFAH